MKVTITIPAKVVDALDKQLSQFANEEPGTEPGTTIKRRVFPDVASWVAQIVNQNIAQFVPVDEDDEAKTLKAEIEQRQRQLQAKANRATATAE
jgi:hypothetical protein